MFKLSTKSRYGLKACFCLAQNTNLMSINEIADSTGVSEHYLEQLFIKLKRANIVRSTRGAGGGYVLSDRPCAITAGMVMRALEGEILVADCVGKKCSQSGNCPTQSIFKRINDGLEEIVESITLQDMLDDFQGKGQKISGCGDLSDGKTFLGRAD